MALENLFVRVKKTIGGVVIDGVISEIHDRKWRTTDHPVEFGADITDHTIIEPRLLTINGEITDTPLGGAAFSAIIDSVSRFGTSTTEGGTRSQQGYLALVALADLRETISVQTRLVLYENMIITGIQVGQNKDTSRTVKFAMTLKEIFIVESEVTELPAEQLEAGKTQDQATSTKNSGKVEGEEIDPDSAKGKSVLLQGVDFMGGIF